MTSFAAMPVSYSLVLDAFYLLRALPLVTEQLKQICGVKRTHNSPFTCLDYLDNVKLPRPQESGDTLNYHCRPVVDPVYLVTETTGFKESLP